MFRSIIKTMRIRQWVKNVFVLAALVFDRQLTIFNSVERSVAGMLLFCLLSSVVYIVNDVMDVEADRQHPKKRNRPIAAGKLPIPVALAVAVALCVIVFPLAYLLSLDFAIICAIYLAVNLAYSRWLKHMPLVDVLVLASCYVLRVASGVTLIHVERFSPWLYVVTTLLALYLGFGKRRSELSDLGTSANVHRPVLDGYTIPLLDQLITIVSSTAIVAYSFYTFSAPNVPENHTMMLTIPFVMYGIFRYLYLIQVEHAGGAPEELVLTDRPLQAAIGLWGLAVVLVFYLFSS
ncbi:MAG TPA: decaprenyl-phosphate phosphoribosyltransferase [Longilinea sp.]|nr:decaprenyl-phosphate phosphoribosyltransferase [Longilinea sp.]